MIWNQNSHKLKSVLIIWRKSPRLLQTITMKKTIKNSRACNQYENREKNIRKQKRTLIRELIIHGTLLSIKRNCRCYYYKDTQGCEDHPLRLTILVLQVTHLAKKEKQN